MTEDIRTIISKSFFLSTSYNPKCIPLIALSAKALQIFLFRFIKNGVTADSMEGMYKKAHAAIRADPAPKAKVDKKVEKKRWTAKKIGLSGRQTKIASQKKEFLAQLEQMKE